MFLIKKECFIYYYYYFYYIELPIQNYQNNTIRVWFLIYEFISKGENPHEKSLRSIIVDLICFSSLNTKTMEMYASSAFYKLFLTPDTLFVESPLYVRVHFLHFSVYLNEEFLI